MIVPRLFQDYADKPRHPWTWPLIYAATLTALLGALVGVIGELLNASAALK